LTAVLFQKTIPAFYALFPLASIRKEVKWLWQKKKGAYYLHAGIQRHNARAEKKQ
jgi:hypothetical protein